MTFASSEKKICPLSQVGQVLNAVCQNVPLYIKIFNGQEGERKSPPGRTLGNPTPHQKSWRYAAEVCDWPVRGGGGGGRAGGFHHYDVWTRFFWEHVIVSGLPLVSSLFSVGGFQPRWRKNAGPVCVFISGIFVLVLWWFGQGNWYRQGCF